MVNSLNRKILITGAGGFIGSHLTEACVKNGFSVKVFLHYNSLNNLGWLKDSKYKNDINIVMGDIRDFDSVYGAMNNCDSVFHLAALIGIPYSYVSPLSYIKTNIIGTYNILESAKLNKVRRVVVTSTSETYGTAQYVPINEIHPLVGQSPYSATKIGADALAVSYFRSFNLPVTIARPFNTYGPRQSLRAVIPSIISQVLLKKRKINLGNISPTRDFTFVEDTVNGFLEIYNSKKFNGEIVNIGMNEEISIKDLVSLIGELIDEKIKIKDDADRLRPSKSEVERLWCDNSKILKYTSWKPKYNLRKGLIKTIDWFKKNEDLFKDDYYRI